ncbi:MAG: hypothetical protein ACQETK_09325, partial [Pseudomonadota bacterium]
MFPITALAARAGGVEIRGDLRGVGAEQCLGFVFVQFDQAIVGIHGRYPSAGQVLAGLQGGQWQKEVYLASMPVSQLKIDKRFVDAVPPTDESEPALAG